VIFERLFSHRQEGNNLRDVQRERVALHTETTVPPMMAIGMCSACGRLSANAPSYLGERYCCLDHDEAPYVRYICRLDQTLAPDPRGPA
jgi:hypothetical protein